MSVFTSITTVLVSSGRAFPFAIVIKWCQRHDNKSTVIKELTERYTVSEGDRSQSALILWTLTVALSTLGSYGAPLQPPQLHLLVLTQAQQLWCLLLATPNWVNKMSCATETPLPVWGDEDNRVHVFKVGKPKLLPLRTTLNMQYFYPNVTVQTWWNCNLRFFMIYSLQRKTGQTFLFFCMCCRDGGITFNLSDFLFFVIASPHQAALSVCD